MPILPLRDCHMVPVPGEYCPVVGPTAATPTTTTAYAAIAARYCRCNTSGNYVAGTMKLY